MIPILYEGNETQFLSNGLGRLSSATSCTVEENLNGLYELTMEYPITGIHYEDLRVDRLISAVPFDGGDPQPFRIYSIERNLNGMVEVRAEHISYLLNKIVVMPFTATSCADALSKLKDNAAHSCPFTFSTTKTVVKAYTVDTPQPIRGLLGGQEGSILDVFGKGEYEFDRFNVKLWTNRGADHGVTLRYGKNLTELVRDSDITNAYTGIVPFWSNGDGYTMTLPEKVVWSEHRNAFAYELVKEVDFSSSWEEQPTEEQLRARAQTYVENNEGWKLNDNIKVSFVTLWQTEEYKDIAVLERVHMGDTVTVVYEALGVEASAKVNKTVYNVLLDRYNEIELGSAKNTLAQAIAEPILEEVPTSSDMERAIANGTKLISGGLGGYVYLKPNATGQPEEILIMNDPDYTQATKLWRLNKNGIAYSNTGYNGTYKQAWTMDGAFYTDWVTAGLMSANIMKTGKITGQSTGSPMEIDIDGGTISCGDKELKVNATNFKLKANGDCEMAGKVTASSGQIGRCTIGDGIQYGKTSFSDPAAGMYLGTDGFSIGQNGRYTGFRVRADGTPVSNYLKFEDNNGHESNYGLWCDNDGRIATGGAMWLNQEHAQTNYIQSPSIIDGYQRLDSDRRVKKNIRYMTPEECSEFILSLRPVEYEFNDERQAEAPDYWRGVRHGFIAQDVVEVLGDEAGNRAIVNKNWQGFYEFKYDELTADLVGICQKQQQRIDDLEKRLANIEALHEGDGK